MVEERTGLRTERERLIYFAGLLDAEGCFSPANGGTPSPHGGKQFLIALKMTDLDIIGWAKQHYGGGKIYTQAAQGNRRASHELRWFGSTSRSLALALAPFLSERRRARVEYLTEKYVPSQWGSLLWREKLAWTAGYVEGEGSITYNNQKAKRGGYYVLSRFYLGTTDQDAVSRVANLLGLVMYYKHGPAHKARGDKPGWEMATSKKTKVEEICALMEPYMFAKKTADIRRIRSLPRGRLEVPYVKDLTSAS